MISKKWVVVLFFIIGATNYQTYAQTNVANYFVPQIYPKAPNTYSLEKFGSYEVNLFTGLPDISIPIYTIDAGGIKIPITLSYHASGIRVQEVASWVGLGWALSAGGTVSRKIVGSADDAPGGYLQGNLQPGTNMIGHQNNSSTVDSITNNWLTGRLEARPDIFSYSFMNHSGKFFLDGTNGFKPALLPFAPIAISYTKNGTGNTSGIDKFVINDEKGNVFTFGDQFIEPTYSGSSSRPSVPANTAWPVENIISQTKRDTVSFTYSGQMVYNPDVASYADVFQDNINGSYSGYNYGFTQGNVVTSTSHVNEQLPQHIYFKNGRVDFNLSSTGRTDAGNTATHGLDNIIVYAYNPAAHLMEQQRKIVFVESYFAGANNYQRLRLDEIQVLDKNNVLIEKYTFSYNNAQLPGYSSLAQDYWGYYNGKTNNTTLTPYQTISAYNGSQQSVNIGGADRNADPNYNQAGVLTSIKYPTGGHTDFVYETNQYYDDANNAHILNYAGGLRVANITSYDGINPTPTIKSYQYNTARNNFILNNSFFTRFQTRQHWATGQGVTQNEVIDCTETYRTFVSSPRNDLEALDAATVVYPSVTEYNGTATANTGKTDYTFRDLSDVLDISSQTGIIVTNSSFYSRGQLLIKTDQKRNPNGSYQPVKTVTNSYTAFPNKRYGNVGLVIGENNINEGSPMPFTGPGADIYNAFVISNYDINSDDNYLTGTVTKNYDSNDPAKFVTEATNYAFENIIHQQPTTITHTDSRGNFSTSHRRYPADYLPNQSAGSTGNYTLDLMLAANMQSSIIESFENYSNNQTAVNGVIKGEFYNYTSSKGNYLAIVPDYISTLKVGPSLQNFTISSVNSGQIQTDSRYIKAINFDNYDNLNNLGGYTARNANPVKIIWDYNGTEPVAKFENLPASTTVANLAYTSFETSNYGNWNVAGAPTAIAFVPTGKLAYPLSSGNITSPSLDNSQAYTVTYWSNGGAVSVSGITGTAIRSANGWTMYQHRIPAGTSAVTISGSVYIDELRLYPATTQVTTYTYTPLVGVTSITDPKSNTTFYEYDTSNRLMNIRDKDRNILKAYCYNYAGQSTNCFVPSALPPVTVYARVEITNQFTTITDYTSGSSNTTGDVYVRLYSDAACTQLYSPAGTTSVIVAEGYGYTYGFGGSGSGSSNVTFTVAANASVLYIGNQTLYSQNTYTVDPQGPVTDYYNYSFDTVTNAGVYTATATIYY